jgi:hypothetical protein
MCWIQTISSDMIWHGEMWLWVFIEGTGETKDSHILCSTCLLIYQCDPWTHYQPFCKQFSSSIMSFSGTIPFWWKRFSFPVRMDVWKPELLGACSKWNWEFGCLLGRLFSKFWPLTLLVGCSSGGSRAGPTYYILAMKEQHSLPCTLSTRQCSREPVHWLCVSYIQCGFRPVSSPQTQAVIPQKAHQKANDSRTMREKNQRKIWRILKYLEIK